MCKLQAIIFRHYQDYLGAIERAIQKHIYQLRVCVISNGHKTYCVESRKFAVNGLRNWCNLVIDRILTTKRC